MLMALVLLVVKIQCDGKVSLIDKLFYLAL